ncbi:MAG TPA: hypothetical protein VGF48_20500 [Thermoanaerobaculia bacterium]|jgi:hypothetical protein
MKKLRLVLLAAAIAAIPFSAQAQSCTSLSCDYITDGAFTQEDTYWTRSANATWDYVPGCLWGNPTTTVAEPNPGGSVSQTFYVNGAYTSYAMRWVAFLLNDTNTAYDQLTVRVYNHSTGATESHYLNGNTYNGSCTYNSWTLSNDYDYDWVTVTFSVAGLTSGTWQVDDVAWFARFY